MAFPVRPRIGIIWGDIPWSQPPPKVGNLWSTGRVRRDFIHALNAFAQVISYQPPAHLNLPAPAKNSSGYLIPYPPGREMQALVLAHRLTLEPFLRTIDILLLDLYQLSGIALALRDELHLTCPAILGVFGMMPKAAETMLFPWQELVSSHDALVFSSLADQAIWRQLVEWSTLQEWVVPLSIDEAVFYPRTCAEQLAIRARYAIPPQAPLLLYVGRLNIEKNLHTLLYLFYTLREQVPDLFLCLAGEEDSSSLAEFHTKNTGYVDWLHSLAASLHIEESFRCIGHLSSGDLACLYTATTIVVNLGTYQQENFGLAHAEALACGTPVVSTAWGGFKDVLKEGFTGYFTDAVLTKHGIRVDWAQAAQTILALLHNPAQREQLGHQAATYAAEHFSIAALSHNLEHVVKDIVRVSVESTPALIPVYKPGQFAERFEQHKHACGWYTPAIDIQHALQEKLDCNVQPLWHPSLFQGEDYELYETLMKPYATYIAAEKPYTDLIPECIPYLPAPLELDAMRFLITCDDPIWPHRRFLDAAEWQIVLRIDGSRTVRVIAMEGLSGNISLCRMILWRLYLEGFVLFASPECTILRGVPQLWRSLTIGMNSRQSSLNRGSKEILDHE